MSSAVRRRNWKTRQAKCTSAFGRTSRPATGVPLQSCSPTIFSHDDRRRVVNAGIERGRDVQLANLRRLADIGVTN